MDNTFICENFRSALVTPSLERLFLAATIKDIQEAFLELNEDVVLFDITHEVYMLYADIRLLYKQHTTPKLKLISLWLETPGTVIFGYKL